MSISLLLSKKLHTQLRLEFKCPEYQRLHPFLGMYKYNQLTSKGVFNQHFLALLLRAFCNASRMLHSAGL